MRGLGLGWGMRRRGGGIPSRIAVPSPLTIIRDSVTNFSDFTLTRLTVNNDAAQNYQQDGLCDQTRETADTGTHSLNKTLTSLTSGKQYAADFVIKPDGRNHALFQIQGGTNNFYGCFDFLDNSIGLTAGPLDSWEIVDLSDGWKFVRLMLTAVATAAYAPNIYHATSKTVYTNIVGDATKGLLVDRFVLSTT